MRSKKGAKFVPCKCLGMVTVVTHTRLALVHMWCVLYTVCPLWLQGFRTELSRTLGFVARAMEREEEGSVDWAGLGMNHTSQPLLDTLGQYTHTHTARACRCAGVKVHLAVLE